MSQPIPPNPAAPPLPVQLNGSRRTWRLAQVAAALIVAVTVPQAAIVVASWHAYQRLDTVGTDPETNFVSSADGAAGWAALSLALTLAATVSLLMWVSGARRNAELISPGRHFRFSRGFAVGAWLVPIANVWWSRAVLDEIWSASRPVGDNSAGQRSQLVLGWWLCVLAHIALRLVSLFTVDRVTVVRPGGESMDDARQTFLTGSLINSVSFALVVLGTVLLAAVILRISRWQTRPGNRPGQRAVTG